MIVQCEHCQTKYRIADEKIKGKGVKVRCAKCENVFTVTPAEDDIQTSPTAQQASKPAAPVPPEPAQSAPEPSAPESSEEVGPGHANGMMGGSVPPLPEDEPAPGPTEAPPGMPPLPPLDNSQDLPVPDAEQQAADTPLSDQPPLGQGLPSIEDGQVDPGAQRPAHEMDQSGLVSPPADPTDQTEDGGFEIEATLREGSPSGSDPLVSEDNAGLPPLTGEAGQDGEWGNIPIDGQEAPDSASGGFGLAGESGYVPPPPVRSEEPIEQDFHDHMSDPLPETSTVPTYQPGPRSSGAGKKIFVALLLLSALGAGGYFAYPTVMEKIQARGQQAEGTLTPDKVRVKALTRTDGKILYSVRGVVRNESAGNVGMIQVEAQFRNAAGDVLTKATSYCGNLFEENDLVNLDLNKVRSDLQNELGQSLSNASINPGQAVPFLVVLDNPPAGINKVTVTISSFKETT